MIPFILTYFMALIALLSLLSFTAMHIICAWADRDWFSVTIGALTFVAICVLAITTRR